jgi:hypothetical protein
MKIRRLTFLLVVLLSGSLSQVLAQEKNDPDEARVKETVMRYLDGWKNHDEVSMKAALHPQASVYQKIESKNDISQISGKRVFRNVERSGRPQVTYTGNLRFVWVDTAGDAATTKVQILYPDSWLSTGKTSLLEPAPGVMETRYISLMKVGDGWKIVSIIYQVREAMPSETASTGEPKYTRNGLSRESSKAK